MSNIPDSPFNGDLLRRQFTTRALAQSGLRPKQWGLVNDSNPCLAVKRADGSVFFVPIEGTNAKFKSVKLTDLASSGVQNLVVDEFGNVTTAPLDNAIWGSITGDILEQTDLQEALALAGAKQDLQATLDTGNTFENFSSVASIKFYRANGTPEAATPVLGGQEPFKIEAFARGTTGYGTGAQGKMSFWSTQAHTDTNKGTEWRVYVTPDNTATMGCPVRVKNNGCMEYFTGGSLVVTRATRFANGEKTIPAIEDIIWALLDGFSVGTNTPVLATDSIIAAIGKLQAQINGSFGKYVSITASASGFIFTVADVGKLIIRTSSTGTFTFDATNFVDGQWIDFLCTTSTATMAITVTNATAVGVFNIEMADGIVRLVYRASGDSVYSSKTSESIVGKYLGVYLVTGGDTVNPSSAGSLFRFQNASGTVTINNTGWVTGQWVDFIVENGVGLLTLSSASTIYKNRSIKYKDGVVRLVYNAGTFWLGTKDAEEAQWVGFGFPKVANQYIQLNSLVHPLTGAITSSEGVGFECKIYFSATSFVHFEYAVSGTGELIEIARHSIDVANDVETKIQFFSDANGWYCQAIGTATYVQGEVRWLTYDFDGRIIAPRAIVPSVAPTQRYLKQRIRGKAIDTPTVNNTVPVYNSTADKITWQNFTAGASKKYVPLSFVRNGQGAGDYTITPNDGSTNLTCGKIIPFTGTIKKVGFSQGTVSPTLGNLQYRIAGGTWTTLVTSIANDSWNTVNLPVTESTTIELKLTGTNWSNVYCDLWIEEA